MGLCNNCQFRKIKQFSFSPEFNAYCTKKNRLVQCNIAKDVFPIQSPWWCPFDTEDKDKFLNAFTKETQKWSTVPKHLQWKDIREGDVIRIPRINGTKPKIIKVVSVANFCISGHEIDDSGKCLDSQITYVYPGETIAKYMVKIKKF